MSALVFAPMFNSEGKRDADEFRREAQAFCKLHGITSGVKLFDSRMLPSARCTQVRDWIEAQPISSVSTIAIFSHGYRRGLQVGVNMLSVGVFADSITKVCTRDLRVILYACDAARDADDDREDEDDPGPGGNGGFADKLRDELVRRGVRATIYAHSTAAHTTRNPFVRRFDPDEMAGGHWVVEPRSAQWEAWRRALKGELRFRFPFLTQGQITAELSVMEGVG